MGLGCKLVKQPLVIGEIIAEIMLGPSLLGLIDPDVVVLFKIVTAYGNANLKAPSPIKWTLV